METRSRLNNVRLVNLPVGAEGPDPCSILENWVRGVLHLAPLRCPIVMERAHRIGPKKDAGTPRRTLMMKLITNYEDKLRIMRAASEKKDILYKN